jgi:hypothetical protein
MYNGFEAVILVNLKITVFWDVRVSKAEGFSALKMEVADSSRKLVTVPGYTASPPKVCNLHGCVTFM